MLIALAGLIVCVVGITVFILTRNPTPEELSASFLQRGGAIYLSFEESDSMAASVHLIGDEFGASQFRALNDALRDAVEELHFLATRISSQTLSDAEPFPNLERLSIAKRRLDQGVVQFIAKHRGLEVLNLRGCEFANSSVLAPLAALENLRSLDLYGVDVRGGVVRPLEGMGLSTLSLRQARLDSMAMQSVGHMVSVNELDLGMADLGDGDLMPIANLADIRKLVLSGHAVRSELLHSLGVATRLQSLYLNGCRLESGSLPEISNLRALREIYIAGATGFSADEMAQQLLRLPSLKTIGVEGTTVVAAILRSHAWIEQSEDLFVPKAIDSGSSIDHESGY
jgi:hypothetical protein